MGPKKSVGLTSQTHFEDEKKYSQMEKKGFVLHIWSEMLHHFVLQTDHKPLQTLAIDLFNENKSIPLKIGLSLLCY